MALFAEAVEALKDQADEELIAIRALAMAFQAYFMVWLDLSEQGYKLVKEGVAILERQNHPKSLVLAYDSLVLNAYFVRNHEEQITVANRMLEISAELDDKWLLAYSQFALSLSSILFEDYQKAIELAEANLRLFEEIDNRIGLALPLIVLGHSALAREDYQAALGYYERCLKISKETRFHYAIQTSSKYLSKVALSMGDLEAAENYLLRSLTISKEIDFIRDIINLLYEFARLRVAQGELERAVELLGLVISHPVSDQSRMIYGRIRDSARELLAELEDELPPDIFTSALERGQESDLDEVVINLIG
jgi:tetratricopeptide (TPR) repeat protein